MADYSIRMRLVLQITASLYILKVRMTILLVTLSVAVRRIRGIRVLQGTDRRNW